MKTDMVMFRGTVPPARFNVLVSKYLIDAVLYVVLMLFLL
jgi:hypothetical protein